MELSVRERQKALTVTLAMLCIACVCFIWDIDCACIISRAKKVRLDDSGRTFFAIKADELFAFFLKLVDSKCHGTYFGIERISFN